MRFFQRLIDKIRNKLNLEQEMVLKKMAVEINPDFENLILGTSCMYYGYRPNNNELNLAIGSQDLYTSYNLYKKLQHSGLKNIIISYSNFSQGFDLVRTNLSFRAAWYKLLYGIDYQYPEIATERGLYDIEPNIQKMIAQYRQNLSLAPSYRGEQFQYKNHKVKIENVKVVAEKHLKNNRREDSQLRYCKMLLEDTKDTGINVYFVIFPRPEFYRQFLPSKEIMFKELYDTCQPYSNVTILDYYDSNDYIAKDFCDDSHLNLEAAIRFTKVLHKDMGWE